MTDKHDPQQVECGLFEARGGYAIARQNVRGITYTPPFPNGDAQCIVDGVEGVPNFVLKGVEAERFMRWW